MTETSFYRRRDVSPELRALGATVILVLLILAGVWWLTQRRPAVPPEERRQAASPNDPIVIEVNGEPIHQSEFHAAVEALPAQLKEQYANEVGRKRVAEELVTMKILEQQARRMGLHEDPNLRGRLHMMEANALATAALQRLVKDADPAKVQELYEQKKSRFETARVKSILLPYQGSRVAPRSGRPPSLAAAHARAQRLVARIRRGEDFSTIARAESVDGRGGDLGEVSRGSLPGELEEVVFSLPPGEVSDPVQSPFGIHIFQVTSRRTPTLEEVRPMLQQEAQNLQAEVILQQLRKEAKVDFKKPYFKG